MSKINVSKRRERIAKIKRKKSTLITLPVELVEISKKYCEAVGISFSELVRQALAEKLERLSLLSEHVKKEIILR